MSVPEGVAARSLHTFTSVSLPGDAATDAGSQVNSGTEEVPPASESRPEPAQAPSSPNSTSGGPPPLHPEPARELTAGWKSPRPYLRIIPRPVEARERPSAPTEPPLPPSVYPNIRVSDEHPVQGEPFTVTVSLDFIRLTRTTGVVDTPTDGELHEIDVHLLVGKGFLSGKR